MEIGKIIEIGDRPPEPVVIPKEEPIPATVPEKEKVLEPAK
jgi:hypothetical protein